MLLSETALSYWPVAATAGVGLVVWGETRAKVATLRKDVEEKASREVVNAHYDEIIRRLDRIEDRVNHKGE